MTRTLSVMFMISGILFAVFFMRETSAVGYNDCFKDDKIDNKIRIGFYRATNRQK
jgi:hypothetical protein